MSIPTFDEFIEPLLRTLHENPDGIRTQDAYEKVAARVGLSEEEKDEFIPSGDQETYKNRIGWAHDRLKRAELSHSAEWGVWQLTDAGREFAEKYSDGIPDDKLGYIARIDRRSSSAEDSSESEEDEDVTKTPDERIDIAVEELKESVADELLGMIHERPFEFFEHLVLDLLKAMGYGAGENSIDHQGGTHDGGIDGVISLDKLGLEKIYIQAKRWESNNVGRPELQQFYGALSERKATKGVYLTTSSFSAEARRFANRISDSIVLIDGEELTSLMIENGVGVRSTRTVRVVDVDRDYFDPE
jgi:restriction system protein